MKGETLQHRLVVMAAPFQEIKQSLRRLYLDDARPWLVGFSGGKLNGRNGLRRHPNPPRVWVSNPIEHLSTEEV